MSQIYFDYNATTPIAPEVFDSMRPYVDTYFANPSSIHQAGQRVKNALEAARIQVADVLNVGDKNEIFFTSGGTESNNAAFSSALCCYPNRKKVIISAVEHSSINSYCQSLEERGYAVSQIGVDSLGRLNIEELRREMSEEVALVSLMMANNETGVLFDLETVASIVKEYDVLFHVDATQVVGKFPISLKASAIDMLSLSGHKFYAPKGVGALYVRKNKPFHSLILGGAQERGKRAGTENVMGIVGMGTACAMVHAELEPKNLELHKLRDRFETELMGGISDVKVNGDIQKRLSNTSNLRFLGVDGEALLCSLDAEGIYASSGSACLSGAQEPSHVLKAMGLSDEEANGSIRFSFGKYTTYEEIEKSIGIIKEIVVRLRQLTLQEQHSH